MQSGTRYLVSISSYEHEKMLEQAKYWEYSQIAVGLIVCPHCKIGTGLCEIMLHHRSGG